MNKRIFAIIAGIAIAVATLFYVNQEEPEDTKQQDSGFNRTETENLMREIGYVQ